MADVAEQVVEEVVRSEYERERGKPMPSKNHSRLQARLSKEIIVYYGDQFDVYSELSLESPNPPYVPDLCIFPTEPSNWREDEVKVSAVPLTVIEIVSPSQTDTQLTAKSVDYFAAGVRSYWLVQPVLRTVFVLLPDGSELVFHNDVLTDPTNGVEVDLKQIFR
ncbi:Uma2 family endonuclease [Spirosoma sp. KUDC1026]|uniref:Uma2 family endonuclease n=1 Tax=Spirosoma sp. KUDC1026 TaxID=2745947 RepID=UPI00159BA234|nr:Uma2 family endonuclease [Spirosoma sp. KUDC1026]QKZ12612.1 Uma2 family endonuclease [Spirosoma sp. KUDC1026]